MLIYVLKGSSELPLLYQREKGFWRLSSSIISGTLIVYYPGRNCENFGES